MPRLAARIDANQPEIVAVMRQLGASVLSLAPMGKGCPDLLVGLRGRNYLIEVKDGSKPPSERELTTDQTLFFGRWLGGPIPVIKSVDEAIEWARKCQWGAL